MAGLTVKRVSALSAPGMYGDGGGLYLRVGPSGGKSWILRTFVHGRRRSLGLGSASLVGLAEARQEATKLRKVARAGGDPDTIRKRQSFTFEEAARKVHANLAPTWKNAHHSAEWLSSLNRYAFAKIGSRPIDTLGASDVLDVLSPIWTAKPETAKRVRQRLGVIFDWAKGAGHYQGDNPVTGIKRALPSVKPHVQHMSAMAWKDLPDFIIALGKREGLSALTLQFLILTATRSGEARGARWDEIEGAIWTVPGVRMKRGKPHRIPLSPEALAVLDKVRGLGAGLVFPAITKSADGEREQSVNVFRALYKRMGKDGITTHGFRSSFRDWASEAAHAQREVAEGALAHTVGDAVERAYARSDLFERRRVLMDAWGQFATGGTETLARLHE
ncbi:Integrase [Jannaschia faecimaris]|uniref:Integrase n=1 Tax=Jannaschia faecimaris TaxID=1244108 RepID=A0A1H3K9U2_9RHOB|nr:integrase arm-type DNA-binding domain-containing protein [Jannaschia faecimaris]SDY48565.1 Integrase [Jannaschia faecimaris]